MEYYQKEDVIDYFELDKFKSVKNTVHRIVSGCNEKSPNEMEVFQKWKDHFKRKRVPFVCTTRKNECSIWIERFAEYVKD